MSKKYLLRLDDACPTMHRENWTRMETMLNLYDVRPMVGVIPANADNALIYSDINTPPLQFWEKVSEWEHKGWAIALHGYDHCYISTDAGINPLWPRSEFAGIPLWQQKDKISRGVEIFADHGINPKYFFAPSHTFDRNTLTALRECSDIRIISDTIALRPYRDGEFTFIPQLGGHCTDMKLPGTWTFCLHPSAMTDADFERTEQFLARNASMFIGFDEIPEPTQRKSLADKLLSTLYFTRRRLKSLLK